ncbi:MAG: CTP synthase [Clostridiales bacterium]|jgi:CTP synthase|nr:CTP synthase [Clostridiales bacterium]
MKTKSNKKYIFVTGGVVSGLGKGITAASLGNLLKARGLSVTIQKFDPYLNADPGTMSPYQHGEVFVTEDGAETDLDLGHYERFVDENLTVNSNVTSGKIYWSVINKERKGDYLGSTVQVIPHVTDAIKERIYFTGKSFGSDIVITEIGGTVGDIESLPFLEAIRQVSQDVGKENALYIHVTLIPYLSRSEEMKTKPTQHSVKELLSIGIQPDIIVCRTEKPMSEEMKDKLTLFCNLKPGCIIQNPDCDVLYEVPLILERENFAQRVCALLSLPCAEPDLTEWTELVSVCKNLSREVSIAIVGKYVELHDAYLSIVESLSHAGIANGSAVKVKWVNSEEIDASNAAACLEDVSGVIVPGGFGNRGIDGKIAAINYARTNNVPFLGICLGMQLAVVEYARNAVNLPDAHSAEIKPDARNTVIDIMPEQITVEDLGGTMRLGAYPCRVAKDTKAWAVYGEDIIFERHRHRYEFNNVYRKDLSDGNFTFAGLSPDGRLVEIIELRGHPFFIGVQFHPEFKSRPNKPHPLFKALVSSALAFRGN